MENSKELSKGEIFFKSLKKRDLVKSYFNPEKIFEVKGEERLNGNGQTEKLIKATNFEKKLYWITSIDCNRNTIML